MLYIPQTQGLFNTNGSYENLCESINKPFDKLSPNDILKRNDLYNKSINKPSNGLSIVNKPLEELTSSEIFQLQLQTNTSNYVKSIY